MIIKMFFGFGRKIDSITFYYIEILEKINEMRRCRKCYIIWDRYNFWLEK